MQFVGRDREMQILQQAWQASAQGTPQFLCFLAESRFGKTRLVQEFYRWLNTHEDPGDYWPDTLEVGNDSLQINPALAGWPLADAAPPWLWWGIRWVKPNLRNASEATRCAVLSDAHHILAHLDSVMRARTRASAEQQAWAGLGKTALNLAGKAIGVDAVGSLIEAFERAQELLRIRATESAPGIPIDQLKLAQQRSLMEHLAQCLLATVAGTDRHAGIPLLLVLDDTQWMDSASLRFLHDLFGEMARLAQTHARPLRILVIATSWEREWQESTARAHRLQPPCSLRDLAERLAIPHSASRAWQFASHPLPALETSLVPVVTEAFPGLTARQAELIASRASGNPGLLAELINNLRRRGKRYFQAMRHDQPLTRAGEADIRRMQVDYHRLIEERLDDLPAQDLRILIAASLFGIRFPVNAVVDLVTRIDGVPSVPDAATAVPAALEKADRPFSFIQKIAADVAEFRTPAYREVLHAQYETLDPDGSLPARLTALLDRWLEDDGGFLAYSHAAQQILVDFAEEWLVRLAEPDDLAWQLRLVVASEILCRLLIEGRVEPIRASCAQWLALADAGQGEPAALSARRIEGVLSTLLLTDQLEQAQRVADGLLDGLLDGLHNSLDDAARAAKFATIHSFRGYIFSARDRWAEALDSHVSALQNLRRLRKPARQRLQSMVEQYIAIGDILFARDAYDAALMNYRKSAVHARKLADRHGARADHLRDLSSALSRIGDVHFARHEFDRALKLREQCVQIDQRIILEHGPTAERLRELSVANFSVAEVLAERGEIEKALGLFRDCVRNDSLLISEYGDTVSRQRDYSNSKSRIGDMLLDLGKFPEACAEYRECVAISEAVRSRSGDTAANLRDLSTSITKVGDTQFNQGYLDEADSLFRHALDLDARMLEIADGNMESLSQLANTKGRLADVHAERGDLATAMNLYKECEEVIQGLADRYGQWGETARSLAIFKGQRAGTLLALDRTEEALEVWQQAQAIWQQLADSANSPFVRQELSSVKVCIADIHWSQDRIEEAVVVYRESLTTCNRLIAEFGETADRLFAVASAKANIAAYLIRRGRPGEAMKLYEECIAIESGAIQKFGSTAIRESSLSSTKQTLGDLLLDCDRFDEGLALFKECLRINKSLTDRFGTSLERRTDASRIIYRIAGALFSNDDTQQAIMMLRQSVAMDEQAIADYGSTTERLTDLSSSKSRLADALADDDALTEALALYEASEAIDRDLLDAAGANSERMHSLAVAISRVADVMLKQDRISEATRRYEKCLALQRKLIAEHGSTREWSRHLGHILFWYGDALMSRNRFSQAAGLFEESLAIAEAAIADYGTTETDSSGALRCKSRLADLLRLGEQYDRALAIYRHCLEGSRRLYRRFGTNIDRSMDLAYYSGRIGDTLLASGRLAEAQLLYRQSVRLVRRVFEKNVANADRRQDLALAQWRLANVLGLRGKNREAKKALDECIATLTALIRDHGSTIDRRKLLSAGRRRLAETLQAAGNVRRARALLRECVRSDEALLHELGGDAPAAVLENALLSRQALALSLKGVKKAEAAVLIGAAMDAAERLRGLGDSPGRRSKTLDHLRSLYAQLTSSGAEG